MKLVIADLDGTLIHKNEMSIHTRNTILALKEQGYLFTLATGRHKDATKKLVSELNIDLPVICTNGAFIYDYQKSQVIHQDIIDPKYVNHALNILDHAQANYLLYTTQHIVSTKQAKENLEARIGQFESVITDSNNLHTYLSLGLLKILVIEYDETKFKSLRTALETLEGVYVLSSQAGFIDIGNRVANKGRALEILTKYLNIPLDEVFAIGDQENDLTMIQKAGIGVAMGNGEEALKQSADFITKPFKEDGFTYAINKFIFNK